MKIKFAQIQENFRNKLSLENNFNISDLKTVAGVDLAYWNRDDKEFAVCCIVVIDMDTHEIIEKKYFSGEITVPYIPSFLAFRELPLVLETVKLLENTPDIYMFDGNGYLHPRNMGIASHASFYLNKPTIGVAKTYFRVDKKTDFIFPENTAGSFTDIVIDGKVYGRTLRTHDNVKPVFIPTRYADLETHVMREKLSGI